MNTESLPPVMHRWMKASLKPASLNFFWGLSLGLLILIVPNVWVQLIGGALYVLAFVWFTLCLMAKKDLKAPDEPISPDAQLLDAKVTASRAATTQPHTEQVFDPEEFAQVWKAYNAAKHQDQGAQEVHKGGRAG